MIAPAPPPGAPASGRPPAGAAPGGGIASAGRVCVRRIWAGRGPEAPRPDMQDPKEVAGREAADSIEDGTTVGLGTGSTVHFSILRLAERIRAEGLEVRCVPTSLDTERKARSLAIPLVALDEVEAIDLTIDGADEIDPRFDMIKGGGGALL